MLMCSLQNAHFPPKNKYDKTGILCHHFNLLLQSGHLEGGRTIDSLLNALQITTFKKLPMHNPIRVIKNIAK